MAAGLFFSETINVILLERYSTIYKKNAESNLILSGFFIQILNTSKAFTVRLRDEAFKKAKTYILENLDEPTTVKKLVEETGVTERTLERAFLERFESTPKTVLKSFRLSGVNRELKRAVIENTLISDVANRWGFWHMGQFAKDYKRMFGELPSITLSK